RRVGTKGSLVVGAGAVTVKLDVRQMGAAAFEGLHGAERGGPVPGQAEVVAVDVDRMRQAEVHDGLGEVPDDLPRRAVERGNGVVEAGDVAAAFFPHFDAAGVDQLYRVSLGGGEQPGRERLEFFRLLLGDLHHGI